MKIRTNMRIRTKGCGIQIGRICLLYLILAGIGLTEVNAQPVTVLKGATVVDGTGAVPVRDAVVVIRGGHILSVGSAAEVVIPEGAEVMDVSGRYLLPGFIDMHAHVAFGPVHQETTPQGVPGFRMVYDEAASRETLATLLAFGITTVRNPGGPTQAAVAIRNEVRTGRIPGPRVYTAGSVIDQTPFPGLTVQAGTEEEIRAEVARQAAAGVDYIKLYVTLPPKLVKAAVEEAHAHGLKIIGHLMMTSWTEAAQLGMDGVVHAIPLSPALLPADKRSAFLQGMRGSQFMYQWFQYVDLDGPEMREAIQALAARNVSLDPTLVIFDALFRGNDPDVIENPELIYTPTSLVDNWRHEFTLSLGWSDADYQEAQTLWPVVLHLVKALYDGGVLLTAGTDVSNPWVIPGVSLHQELKLLNDAGILPLEVLKIATHNGAQALGIISETGTIETGKRADLVLLKADPVADITNTRSIEWVMQGGQVIQPETLWPPRVKGEK